MPPNRSKHSRLERMEAAVQWPTGQPERWTLERLRFERAALLNNLANDRSTHLRFSSALQSYLDFCSSHHFDPEPTIDTLSFYIVYMSHHIVPRSLRKHLNRIVTELEPLYPQARVKEIAQSTVVSRALRGSIRRCSSQVRQKEPLTSDDLTFVTHSIPAPISHDDLLFCTLLQTGFFGLCRLDELVWPDDSSRHTFSKVTWRLTAELDSSSYSFLLQRDKEDSRFEGNKVVIHNSSTDLDPRSTFLRYLRSRDTLFPLLPQLWLRADGSVPLRGWFVNRLRSFFPRAKGGRSMRAGGAICLAAAGVPMSEIQAIGRWSHPAFERYICHHPGILHAVLSYNRTVPHPPRTSV